MDKVWGYDEILAKVDEVAREVHKTWLDKAAKLDNVAPMKALDELSHGRTVGTGTSQLVDFVYKKGEETPLGPAFITLVIAKVVVLRTAWLNLPLMSPYGW